MTGFYVAVTASGRYEITGFECPACRLQVYFDPGQPLRVEHCGKIDTFKGNLRKLPRRRLPAPPTLRQPEPEVTTYSPDPIPQF